MKSVKKYLKMISPWNNMEEMPVAVYTLKKLLAFCVIYFIAAVVGEGIVIGGLTALGYDPLHGIMPDGNAAMLLQYYGFCIFLIGAIIYCKCIEKRQIKTMGFQKSIYDYLAGAGIAMILLVIIMGIACITGGISYVGIYTKNDCAYMFALLGGLMIQGAAEEALCRGFLMTSLLKKHSVWAAIFISSTAFAFPHFGTLFAAEFKYRVVGIINLYLVSVIFSLLALSRMNIWVSCGLHSVWNFLLYGIFGLALSGSEANDAGIICFKVNGENLLNGGMYGMEASMITTIILGLTVVILWKYWSAQKMWREKDGI